jgi:hypothetical protein
MIQLGLNFLHVKNMGESFAAYERLGSDGGQLGLPYHCVILFSITKRRCRPKEPLNKGGLDCI